MNNEIVSRNNDRLEDDMEKLALTQKRHSSHSSGVERRSSKSGSSSHKESTASAPQRGIMRRKSSHDVIGKTTKEPSRTVSRRKSSGSALDDRHSIHVSSTSYSTSTTTSSAHRRRSKESDPLDRSDRLRGSSQHRSSGERRSSSNGRKKTSTPVGSTSSHGERRGGSSSMGATGSGRSSTRSKLLDSGVARHKSSERLDQVAVAAAASSMRRNDDLSAATLHGKSSISRIRSSKREIKERKAAAAAASVASTATSDRRGRLQRAMSRENVKRPEEYGPEGAASYYGSSVSQPMESVHGEVRRGRRRPKKEETVEEPPPSPSGDDDDSDADSFAEVEEHLNDNSGRHGSRQHQQQQHYHNHKSPAKSSSGGSGGLPRTPQRRDLLQLLRDQKTVDVEDLADKDNRRILHFIMYQHKLKVDMNALQANIDLDVATSGAAAFVRPPLPLYVEPA